MLPHTFTGSNFVYTKPQGWTDEECMDLPGARCLIPIDDHGTMQPAIISCWKLSKEDLEEISRTGQIFLSISQPAAFKNEKGEYEVRWEMPPVSLFTEHPFGHLQSDES